MKAGVEKIDVPEPRVQRDGTPCITHQQPAVTA
jgi:hypothetical protein